MNRLLPVPLLSSRRVAGLLLPLAVGLVLASCAPAPLPLTYVSYGTEITADDALPIGKVVADPDAYDGQTVKVAGVVHEVCQNKGCWMTLDGGEGQTVRVTFRDYGYFVPKDIAGRTVVLEGSVRREELSVETLRHYAEDEGKSEEEIAAITSPQIQLTVVADGVLVAEPAIAS